MKAEDLAYDAAKKFDELHKNDPNIRVFSFKSYAVEVKPIENGYGLVLFDKNGKYVTNIAV